MSTNCTKSFSSLKFLYTDANLTYPTGSRSLEELGQNEIASNTIGTMVMEGLKDLDPVAYVRFASVYRNFREEKDFIQFVDKIDVFKKK